MFTLVLAITLYYHENVILYILSLCIGIFSDFSLLFLLKQPLANAIKQRKQYKSIIISLQNQLTMTNNLLEKQCRNESSHKILKYLFNELLKEIKDSYVFQESIQNHNTNFFLNHHSLKNDFEKLHYKTEIIMSKLQYIEGFLFPKKHPIIFKIKDTFDFITKFSKQDMLSKQIQIETQITEVSILGYEHYYGGILFYSIEYMIQMMEHKKNSNIIFINIYVLKNNLFIKIQNTYEFNSKKNKLIENKTLKKLYIIKHLIQNKLKGTIKLQYKSYYKKKIPFIGAQFKFMIPLK